MDFSFLDDWTDDEPEAPQPAGDGYRHIWVVAECHEGAPIAASLEALGKAREMADQLGVYVYAVLAGHQVGSSAEAVISHGADSAMVADDPSLAQYQPETYARLLAEAIGEHRPEIVLFSATPFGNDLAPRLSQRLHTGLSSHCVGLELDMSERLLVGTFPVLGGEMTHTVTCPAARPQIATLQPGAFRVPFRDAYRTGQTQHLDIGPQEGTPTLAWTDLATALDLPPEPLSKARIVVCAGRGLGDSEGFALAERLAEALGGELAGTRGAFDEGWIPEEKIVGVGWQTIAPDLYIACGVSGDVHHCFGLRDAKFIVAINPDESAPIMKAANVAVVGDAIQVIPAILEALAA